MDAEPGGGDLRGVTRDSSMDLASQECRGIRKNGGGREKKWLSVGVWYRELACALAVRDGTIGIAGAGAARGYVCGSWGRIFPSGRFSRPLDSIITNNTNTGVGPPQRNKL